VQSLDDLVKAQPGPTPPGSPGTLTGNSEAAAAAAAAKPGPIPAAGQAPADGESLISFIEMITPLVCRMTAIRYGVKWTKEMETESRLSREEKASLRLSANGAAPLIGGLLNDQRWIALGFFGMTYAAMISDRAGKIKDRKPKPAPKIVKDTPDGTEETETPPEKRGRGRPPKPKVE
jgi:hypothetical protein